MPMSPIQGHRYYRRVIGPVYLYSRKGVQMLESGTALLMVQPRIDN